MFLNFAEISKIPFKHVLDWQSVPYTITQQGEIRGEGFRNIGKNLYFNPTGDDKGSVINWLAEKEGASLRDAAAKLKNNFYKKKPKPVKREIPNLSLEYHPLLEKYGITEETARELEIGYCKKGIMKGKIAFKVGEAGYVGKEIKNDKWFVPKGLHIGSHVYNLHNAKSIQNDCAILVSSPLEVAYLHSKGFGYSVGLFGRSATDQQIVALDYKRIILIHPAPENIVLRLSAQLFVKYATDTVLGKTTKEIMAFF